MLTKSHRGVFAATVLAAMVLFVSPSGHADEAKLFDEVNTLSSRLDSSPRSAAVVMGALYLRGGYIQADPIAAAGWFRRAADAGDATAAYILARMYVDGVGVAQDERAARSLLERRYDDVDASLASLMAGMLKALKPEQAAASPSDVDAQRRIVAKDAGGGDLAEGRARDTGTEILPRRKPIDEVAEGKAAGVPAPAGSKPGATTGRHLSAEPPVAFVAPRVDEPAPVPLAVPVPAVIAAPLDEAKPRLKEIPAAPVSVARLNEVEQQLPEAASVPSVAASGKIAEAEVDAAKPDAEDATAMPKGADQPSARSGQTQPGATRAVQRDADTSGPFLLFAGSAANPFDARDVYDRAVSRLGALMRGVSPDIRQEAAPSGDVVFVARFAGIADVETATKICEVLRLAECRLESVRRMQEPERALSYAQIAQGAPGGVPGDAPAREGHAPAAAGSEDGASAPREAGSSFGFNRPRNWNQVDSFGHLRVAQEVSTFAQISSVFRQQDADREVKRINRRYGDVLSGLNVGAEPVTSNSGTIWRVMVYGFQRTQDATRFCGVAASRGDQCYVRNR